MNRPRMTSAASALLRALLSRPGADRNRIVLSNWTTIDWHSLTFTGERHLAGFVVSGPDAAAQACRWTDGLEQAELDVGASSFVAEIALSGPPTLREDGSVLIELEALTIAD